MKKYGKKGFTLIELISVLVIMAIIALIATPLVMSIIRKARVSADKRSIDAYGRSIELAIAGYLLDNGKFPTDVSQLSIEYSGNQVVCETTQINPDSSVYLAGCTVAGRNVEGYSYGEDKIPPAPTDDAYEIGDEVTYNGVDYYVIEDSDASDTTVKLLKKTPLTVDEVNQYGGVGTDNNHVNRYTDASVGTSYNSNGYGGMVYYSSETCGYVNNNWISSGCINNYSDSEVKYVVDAWSEEKVPSGLVEARLISFDDLTTNLGYNENSKQCTGSCWYNTDDNVPEFIYNSNYRYWTSSAYNDNSTEAWFIEKSGNLSKMPIHGNGGSYTGKEFVVRPVIVLSKSAL